MKDKFISYYTEHIMRAGSEELLEYLMKSDFFTAPASTRFHGSYEGGLVEHSVNVYERLVKVNEAEGGLFSAETVAVCGLLHDLCKVGFYTIGMRNRKNAAGQWEQYPFYAVDDKLPFGHGEKSQYIVASFMKLSRDESMAIRWHMGGYDKTAAGGDMATISEAFRMFPLAVMTHMADLLATYIDEAKPKGAQ